MIRVKGSVRPYNLWIMAAAANVAYEMQTELVITAGMDGKHMTGSRHYVGEALDIRSKGLLTTDRKETFLEKIRTRLGPGYDCILEGANTPNEHFHIEYDPK